MGVTPKNDLKWLGCIKKAC